MKLLKLGIKIYNITKQMMLPSGYLDSNYIYILPKNEMFGGAIIFSPRFRMKIDINLKRNKRKRV